MSNILLEIADQFSKGAFNKVYPHFKDDIKWNLVGSPIISGRENVIAHCEKMIADMAGSIMNNTKHFIAGDAVIVQGFCTYTGADNSPGKVEYCDIYNFEKDKLSEITSYIIEIAQGL